MNESKGVGYPAINPTSLVSLLMCLPPLPKQCAIANFLDAETAKIDALIGKIENQIELLNEYKQSLITAAVTGKIDVREEATTNRHE